MSYYQAESGGSYEIFYVDLDDVEDSETRFDEPGYYWWACWPGCLPDGDPCGPFDSEDEAYEDLDLMSDGDLESSDNVFDDSAPAEFDLEFGDQSED